MTPRSTLAVLLAGALAFVPACSSDDDSSSSTTTAPRSTTTGTDGATTTPDDGAGGIADVDFQNFTFRYPSIGSDGADDLEEVTVTDGVFDDGEAPSNFHFEVLDTLLGDYDGDGEQEAAVSIYYNTGGTGQFTDLLVYRWTGTEPEYVTSAGVGDRGDGGIDLVSNAPAGGVPGEVLVVRRNADAQGACCPTALEEHTLRLRDDELVEVGDPERWAIVRVGLTEDGEVTDEPTEVKFLTGTTRADLTGDATTAVAATFDAEAGQSVDMSVDPDVLAENAIVVSLSGPDGAAGKFGTDFDADLSVTLQQAGSYRIEITPVGEVDEALGRYFDIDLRITG